MRCSVKTDKTTVNIQQTMNFFCIRTGQVFHNKVIVTIAEAAELHEFLHQGCFAKTCICDNK